VSSSDPSGAYCVFCASSCTMPAPGLAVHSPPVVQKATVLSHS
jgi:hypothetical protein